MTKVKSIIKEIFVSYATSAKFPLRKTFQYSKLLLELIPGFQVKNCFKITQGGEKLTETCTTTIVIIIDTPLNCSRGL